MRGTGISPCDAFDTWNDDACVDSEVEDEDYSPSPAYKLIRAT